MNGNSDDDKVYEHENDNETVHEDNEVIEEDDDKVSVHDGAKKLKNDRREKRVYVRRR